MMDSCLALRLKGSIFLVPDEGQDKYLPIPGLIQETQSQLPSVHRLGTLALPIHSEPNAPSSGSVLWPPHAEPVWCLMLKLCTHAPSVLLNSGQALAFTHHHDASLGALPINIPIGCSCWIELKVTTGNA